MKTKKKKRKERKGKDGDEERKGEIATMNLDGIFTKKINYNAFEEKGTPLSDNDE